MLCRQPRMVHRPHRKRPDVCATRVAAQRAPPVQIPKRSSGDTVQPKTQLGTDNRDSESIFGKLGEKSGLVLGFVNSRYNGRGRAGPPFRSSEMTPSFATKR